MQFLFWEYLFRFFDIVSLQCSLSDIPPPTPPVEAYIRRHSMSKDTELEYKRNLSLYLTETAMHLLASPMVGQCGLVPPIFGHISF
jgi:hypothetical protein